MKIGASLKSASVFLAELEQARIPLPWCPALSEDVYASYCAWCTANRIRSLAIRDFVPEFMRLAQVRRITAYVPDPEMEPAPLFVKKTKRLRRILLIGHWARRTPVRDARAIRWGIRRFHYALHVWRCRLGSVDGTLIKKSDCKRAQVLEQKSNVEARTDTLIMARVAVETVND